MNRTELWSPIPADDDDFKKIAWLRNDAESNNSALEDKLFNGRAHSVGRQGQRANLLGYALLVNCLTLYLAKRPGQFSGGPPPPQHTIAARSARARSPRPPARASPPSARAPPFAFATLCRGRCYG